MSKKLVTACVQTRAHDRDAFPTRFPGLLALLEHAAKQAELVVAPEGTVPAYFIGIEPVDQKQIALAEEAIKQIARRHKATIVYGAARVENGRTWNSAVVIGPEGDRLGHADKRFLWHFDRRWFSPGETLQPILTPVGNLGVLICADGRIPTLAAGLADRGANLLVVPTAWVSSGRNPDNLENIQADLFAVVRSRENGVPLIAANKVGVERHGIAYCGKSQIISATGAVLARAGDQEECVIVAEVEIDERPRPRRSPMLTADGDRPDIGGMPSVRIALTPSSDPQEVRALARDAALADANLLIARAAPFEPAEIPVLNAMISHPEHTSVASISFVAPIISTTSDASVAPVSSVGNLRIGLAGSAVLRNPHALTQARLAGVDLFLWPGLSEDDEAESLAFTRTRAVELRAGVITLNERRASACDPDGTIVCGTYDDYRVAAFTHDPARCAQSTVAPHTDVLLGLRTAMTMLIIIILLLHPCSIQAQNLPDHLTAPAPFPSIISQSYEQEDVTLGVRFGRYYLMTVDGPLVVHALSVNLHEPTLHVDTVLAHDHLISKGETVSSMASRTGAVAGINADFFDIGATYQPIGMVVHDAALLRSPGVRAVMAITKDRTVHFETYRFGGTVRDQDGRSWNLSTLNEWPPHDGVSLLTPAFGPIPAQVGSMLVDLAPLENGRYRVTKVSDTNVPQEAPAVPTLAYGSAALLENGVPDVGNTLTVTDDLDPPLDAISTAVGGGPLLLRDGLPYEDPHPPAPGLTFRRVPVSGALRQSDGTLVLVEVDGRAPHFSIGLTRPEFTALLRALGGVDGMSFDGGGSATIVARIMGESVPGIRNTPSDGRERPVTDGVFIYSDTPLGPPARLALRRGMPRILAGATATLDPVVVDAAGHVLSETTRPLREHVEPAMLARVFPDGHLLAGNRAGNGVLHLERRLDTPTDHQSILTADLPLRVVDRITRLRIQPEHPNPQPGEPIMLSALGFDASGAPIDIDGRVRWQASDGAITTNGMYHTRDHDTVITARVGSEEKQVTMRVGNRVLPIDIFRHNSPAVNTWTFASEPSGGPGSAEIDQDDVLALSYDFSAGERAAYADTDISLEGELLALSVEVLSDGAGEGLRVILSNADGDAIPITLAHHLTTPGRQTLTVPLPPVALGAQAIKGFVVVAAGDATVGTGTSAGTPAKGGATVVLRNLRGIFAGTSTPIPPYRVRTPSAQSLHP